MRKYKVYLFRSPECIRGWLAYLKFMGYNPPTVTVEVEAESGSKAKNKAVTMANKGFKGIKIVDTDYDDSLYGLNNHPDIKLIIENLMRK